jgi:hypothetical protein
MACVVLVVAVQISTAVLALRYWPAMGMNGAS